MINLGDILAPMVWPLCFLLVAFTILRQVKNRVEPIFDGMTSTLKVQATRYALAWSLCMLYAAAASLQALGDVAEKMGWVYVDAFAQVVQPAVVAVIAFVNKAPEAIAQPKTTTTPPFASTTTPPQP